jgi:hypothetical protein
VAFGVKCPVASIRACHTNIPFLTMLLSLSTFTILLVRWSSLGLAFLGAIPRYVSQLNLPRAAHAPAGVLRQKLAASTKLQVCLRPASVASLRFVLLELRKHIAHSFFVSSHMLLYRKRPQIYRSGSHCPQWWKQSLDQHVFREIGRGLLSGEVPLLACCRRYIARDGHAEFRRCNGRRETSSTCRLHQHMARCCQECLVYRGLMVLAQRIRKGIFRDLKVVFAAEDDIHDRRCLSGRLGIV